MMFLPRRGTKALYEAALSGDRDTVQSLLGKGVHVDARHNGFTPLHGAAISDHSDVAALLLDEKADVNARKDDAFTPLHFAVLRGHKDVATLLLARGADANMGGSDDGPTVLATAAEGGHVAMAELLLMRGANVDGKGKGGMAPLHWAAMKGHRDMVEFLLGHGADIEARDNDGYTALRYACDCQQEEAGEFLLAKGANRNAKDNKGVAPDIWWPPEGWPRCKPLGPPGNHTVAIKNPNDFRVRVGLRCGDTGCDFKVPPFETRWIEVPGGDYEMYFQYSSEPTSLHRGRDFSLPWGSTSYTTFQLAKHSRAAANGGAAHESKKRDHCT